LIAAGAQCAPVLNYLLRKLKIKSVVALKIRERRNALSENFSVFVSWCGGVSLYFSPITLRRRLKVVRATAGRPNESLGVVRELTPPLIKKRRLVCIFSDYFAAVFKSGAGGRGSLQRKPRGCPEIKLRRL
jgi:hypothetical protein